MNREYTDLIDLIAQNREAMTYFKALPDKIKSELSKSADQILTIESLKEHAERISKKNALNNADGLTEVADRLDDI